MIATRSAMARNAPAAATSRIWVFPVSRSSGRLASVRRAEADPFVLDLIEMDRRIVFSNGKVQVCGGETADRGHHRIGSNDTVALGGDEGHSRIQQLLLLEKNIESRALNDLRFLPDAVERDFVGLDRSHGRLNDAARAIELAPGRDHRRTHQITLEVGLQPGLTERFLGLPRAGVDFAAFIDRYSELTDDRAIEETQSGNSQIVVIAL